MIPRHITLQNFLSYRQANLDFAGLHVACIAGPNGAGKSSLLEAIAWAVWGQSRVAADDDVIHQGAMEARVTFEFHQGEHSYRILRGRHRVQGTSLEFQVQTEAGYRVLTQRGVRATQGLICRHLKLDYETFINSAYLRQGRADDFMLKRPSDRKQILADLLKLDHYDQLADRAKEQARQLKAELTLRQTQIDDMQTALQDYDATVQRLDAIQTELQTLEQQQTDDRRRLQRLRTLEQDYQQQQQQLELVNQQHDHLAQVCRQTADALAQVQAQLRQGTAILAQATDIQTGVARLQALEAEDTQLNQQFQQYQTLQQQLQPVQAQYERQQQALQSQQQQKQSQLAAIATQLADLDQILRQQAEVKAARQKLAAAKAHLKHLDALQLQAEPLLQRRQQLQGDLRQAQTQLKTRLEDLTATAAQLARQQEQQPQLVATVQDVSATRRYLERRRLYQEQVREKGLERRSFMEALQATQRNCEGQLAQVAQKLQLLTQPEAACPLCDRPLDHHHRTLVEERHRLEQQDIQAHIWVIREQLAASEREIQVLRQEYRAVEAELALYAPVLHKQGQLEVQLANQATVEAQLQQLETERQQLQQCLEANSYATDIQAELRHIDQTLSQLAYDDRDHALARGQVDRLRWADIKHHEIKQARQRQGRLQRQQQDLTEALGQINGELESLAGSELKQELDRLEAAIAHLNYAVDHHQQVRQALQAAQPWRLRQQKLHQWQQQQPQQSQRLADLQAQYQAQHQDLQALTERQTALATHLNNLGYDPQTLPHLEAKLQQQQQQREALLAQGGALAQQQQHLASLQQQLSHQQQQLLATRHQQRVYQELAQAFGRNGIQAMMIENLLPQLEAETNRLLGRLSNHQLHVQFVTQRASKSRQTKLIDTLDIVIADAQGTRPYETYSGGEGFRINFAIRLALARLLAQRSGTALQLLIIDEGFGSQDQQGCDRLIAAINAIAVDFACILAVTHIPHFRDAFQARIDVTKTSQGSQLTLSV